MKAAMLQRYRAGDRLLHWAVVLCFLLLAVSGLALFHPSLFFLTNLLGGGVWARILHPFIGVLMCACFVVMARRFWRHNRLSGNDRQWLRQWRDLVANRKERLPEAGRYNAGQKLMFWVMVVCMLLLLLTGVALWQPYFTPQLPITLVRWAALLHAFAATVLMLGILIHVYAALWVKGTLGAMLRGVVTHAWARRHHPAWYRETQERDAERPS